MCLIVLALAVLSSSLDTRAQGVPGAATPVEASSGPSVGAAAATPTDAASSLARARRTVAAVAHQAFVGRVALGVACEAAAAGFLGAGVTYFAVSVGDPQLSAQEVTDTQRAGLAMGAAAVVPAVVGAVHLLTPSDAEIAAVALAAATDDGAAVLGVVRTLATEAEGDVLPWLMGGGLVVAGLASAGAGAYFLLMPHLHPDPSTAIAHSPGAELIGLGVSSVAMGIATGLLADSSARAAVLALEDLPQFAARDAPARPRVARADDGLVVE